MGTLLKHFLLTFVLSLLLLTPLALAKTTNSSSDTSNKISFIPYGQITYGFDNNVNAATDTDYAGYLTLTGLSYQASDYNTLIRALRTYNQDFKSNYVLPQLGIKATYEPEAKYSVFWDVNGSQRTYLDVDGYDVGKLNTTLGIDYELTPLYTLSGSVYYQEYGVDGKRYRESPIATISLSRSIGEHNILRVYNNDGILSYIQDRTQSVNMYVGGLEWMCFNERNNLSTEVYLGRNQPRGDLHHGSKYYGVDIYGQHYATKKLSFTAEFVYQGSVYDEKEFADAPRRNDAFIYYSGGAYYKFHPKLTCYINAGYTNNLSNVLMYGYDRFEAITGISFNL